MHGILREPDISGQARNSSSEEELPQKLRFARYALLLGGLAALVGVVIDYIGGYIFVCVVEAITTILAVGIFFLTANRRYLKFGLRFVVLAGLLMFIVSAITQMDSTGMLIWVACYPVAFFYLTDLREGLFLGVICILSLLFAYYIHPFLFEAPRVSFTEMIQAIMAYLTSASFAVFYEKVRIEQHDLLLQTAQTDPLTGIRNRRILYQEMERLASLNRRNGSSYAFILFDLDEFKKMNDTYGHTVGDDVLREVGRTISRPIREGDLLARWGGEEFAVILPETDNDGAIVLADRLREAISNHLFPTVGRITASFGVAVARDGESADCVVGRADTALYRAKMDGKNCVKSAEELNCVS
jgi:diguanylate cyclase (GGDEF)-like protein